MAIADLTAERLRELFNYDPETGIFTWRQKTTPKSNSITVGGIAGTIGADGYTRIMIHRATHKGHRLAWLYVHGCHAPSILDHINGNRSDNRITNLRLATRSLNSQNRGPSRSNKANTLGVYIGRKGNYCAAIGITLAGKSRRLHLGTFASLDEASTVYLEAKTLMHPGAIISRSLED